MKIKRDKMMPWMVKATQSSEIGMVLEVKREKKITQTRMPSRELPLSQAMRCVSWPGKAFVR